MAWRDTLLNLPFERGFLAPFASEANPFMRWLGPDRPRLEAQESALDEAQPWMYGYQALPSPAPSTTLPEPVETPVPREYVTLPGERPPRGPTRDPQVLADQLRAYWYEPWAAGAGLESALGGGWEGKKKKRKKKE